MNQRHLSDDRLIDLCLAGPTAGAGEPHLAVCAECELRRSELSQLLGDVAQTAAAEADAAFPAERLAKQRARILQRVEQDGRPARVIAFPAGQPHAPSLLRSPRTARWTAAAAAAAFVVGLLAGHMAHRLPASQRPVMAPQMVANEAGGATLRAVSTTMSDDEFLGQIELAVGNPGPAALKPLDAVTPRAWDVR